MKTPLLNIALLGCGRWAQTAHLPLITSSKHIENITLSGVLTPEEGAMLAKRYGVTYTHDWKKVVQDPTVHAVVISTPHQLHYEQIKESLLNNKHVHVDKPPTLRLAELEELIMLAQEKGLFLSVHAQMKYMPGISNLQRILRSEFSSIYQVNGYFWQKIFDDYKDSWRANNSLSGGGIMIDSGYHIIDTVHYIVDSLQPTAPTYLSHSGVRNASDAVGLLTYTQNGSIISISAIRGAPKMSQRQRIEIFGDAGYLEFQVSKSEHGGDSAKLIYQRTDGKYEEASYDIGEDYLSDPLHIFIESIYSENKLMISEMRQNLKIAYSVVKVLDGAYRQP